MSVPAKYIHTQEKLRDNLNFWKLFCIIHTYILDEMYLTIVFRYSCRMEKFHFLAKQGMYLFAHVLLSVLKALYKTQN